MSNLGSTTKVCVAVRVRPLIDREKKNDSRVEWSVEGNILQQVDSRTESRVGLPYSFDHVFSMGQSTKELYQNVVSPIVDQAFAGFNGTILCYGQTSSGKTYTLYGTENEEGILTLTAQYLFKRVSEDVKRTYIIRVGLVEIYNEKVSDLLSEERSNEVQIVETNGLVIPKDLREIEILKPEDMLDAMAIIQRERQIGETRMNTESSRSHTILRILIESVAKSQVDETQPLKLTNALLNFVDLAGSEKAGQTGAQGEKFKEATYINKSLSVLSQVVMQLSEDSIPGPSFQGSGGSCSFRLPTSNSVSSKKTSRFVNFRDSKLTRILQSSLSGNAYIAMICNVTPANVDETHSTLRFARAAKKIQTQPRANHLLASNSEYQEKIRELQKLLHGRSTEVEDLKRQLDFFMNFCRPNMSENYNSTAAMLSAITTERRKTICPSSLLSFRKETSDGSGTTMSLFSETFSLDQSSRKRPSSEKRYSLTTKLQSQSPPFLSSEETSLKLREMEDVAVQTESQYTFVPKRIRLETPPNALRFSQSRLRLALEEDQEEKTEHRAFFDKEITIHKEEIRELKEKLALSEAKCLEVENLLEMIKEVEMTRHLKELQSLLMPQLVHGSTQTQSCSTRDFGVSCWVGVVDIGIRTDPLPVSVVSTQTQPTNTLSHESQTERSKPCFDDWTQTQPSKPVVDGSSQTHSSIQQAIGSTQTELSKLLLENSTQTQSLALHMVTSTQTEPSKPLLDSATQTQQLIPQTEPARFPLSDGWTQTQPSTLLSNDSTQTESSILLFDGSTQTQLWKPLFDGSTQTQSCMPLCNGSTQTQPLAESSMQTQSIPLLHFSTQTEPTKLFSEGSSQTQPSILFFDGSTQTSQSSKPLSNGSTQTQSSSEGSTQTQQLIPLSHFSTQTELSELFTDGSTQTQLLNLVYDGSTQTQPSKPLCDGSTQSESLVHLSLGSTQTEPSKPLSHISTQTQQSTPLPHSSTQTKPSKSFSDGLTQTQTEPLKSFSDSFIQQQLWTREVESTMQTRGLEGKEECWTQTEVFKFLDHISTQTEAWKPLSESLTQGLGVVESGRKGGKGLDSFVEGESEDSKVRRVTETLRVSEVVSVDRILRPIRVNRQVQTNEETDFKVLMEKNHFLKIRSLTLQKRLEMAEKKEKERVRGESTVREELENVIQMKEKENKLLEQKMTGMRETELMERCKEVAETQCDLLKDQVVRSFRGEVVPLPIGYPDIWKLAKDNLFLRQELLKGACEKRDKAREKETYNAKHNLSEGMLQKRDILSRPIGGYFTSRVGKFSGGRRENNSCLLPQTQSFDVSSKEPSSSSFTHLPPKVEDKSEGPILRQVALSSEERQKQRAMEEDAFGDELLKIVSGLE